MTWSESLCGHLGLINARLTRIERTLTPGYEIDCMTSSQSALQLPASTSVGNTDHPLFRATNP